MAAELSRVQVTLRLARLVPPPGGRVLVALAGLPGSGKSTLAAQLAQEVNAELGEGVVVPLGMDGFHLTLEQLKAMPDPEAALRRRGAPWTFDAHGLAAALKRARDARDPIGWPAFEHSVGDPVPDAVTIPGSARLLLVEGLYLLMQAPPWDQVTRCFDAHWYLDSPRSVAMERLSRRHMQAWGISQVEALRRIGINDGLNAELVLATRDAADTLIVGY